MEAYQHTEALVLDVRNNPGGRRDLIAFFSNYICDPKAPWIANVAVVRKWEVEDPEWQQEIVKSRQSQLQARYLRAVDSQEWNEQAQRVLSAFMEDFVPGLPFDSGRYTRAHAMMLPLDAYDSGAYRYTKPVYILANELTFSAASILVSAFKGYPNVYIVGKTTDGSSGMSKKGALPHSQMSYKFSRMVSFQRDGTPLDGHGTVPDMALERDMDQLLGTRDSQLQELLQYIDYRNIELHK